jgi:cytochrome b561
MIHDSKQKLSATTVGLHWIVALTVAGLWPLGYYMAHTRTYSLWPLHQSTGTVLLAVVLVRVAWRYANGWPQPVGEYSPTEQVLAKIVHWTLLLSLIIMPVTGLVSGYAGGYDITVFGWQIIPDNPNHAIVPADAIHKLRVNPRSEIWHDDLQVVHRVVARILLAAVALHVVGALKHHLIDRDGTLRRMLGASVR